MKKQVKEDIKLYTTFDLRKKKRKKSVDRILQCGLYDHLTIKDIKKELLEAILEVKPPVKSIDYIHYGVGWNAALANWEEGIRKVF